MLKPYLQQNKTELANYLASRAYEISPDTLIATSKILEDVRKNKDQALKDYTKRFDGIEVETFRVPQEVIDEQAKKADPFFVQALEEAAQNITFYHKEQKRSGYHLDSQDGVYLGQMIFPLASVGIYVPGGRALYPSSVLMNAIPAKIAGVERIVMTTPPNADGGLAPNLAAAAKVAGVTEIYTVGGAQAIAALAYGTESIQPVDKIVGPGNMYVAAAKKLVYGKVDIDMIAGPSEILVIADENANPAFVAADLLSQAEHDPMASSILISTSQDIIDQVNQELRRQTDLLPKKAIIEQSLANYGTSILADTIEDAIAIANEVAPEHLELQVQDAGKYRTLCRNAGSIFLGYTTCESIGDYFGGTNHVLPTSQTARFSSPLSVDDFVKKSSYMYYSREALVKHGRKIVKMAEEENLEAHANAVSIRLKEYEK
ncbi:MAG: histidinol dehydrogenase [Allobaculum sp.]